MISVGILFDNKKRLPLNVAVAMAKREFGQASHTRGETARVVVVHPDQAPEEAVIGGLTVYTDRMMPLHRIRVCTVFEALPSPPLRYAPGGATQDAGERRAA